MHAPWTERTSRPRNPGDSEVDRRRGSPPDPPSAQLSHQKQGERTRRSRSRWRGHTFCQSQHSSLQLQSCALPSGDRPRDDMAVAAPRTLQTLCENTFITTPDGYGPVRGGGAEHAKFHMQPQGPWASEHRLHSNLVAQGARFQPDRLRRQVQGLVDVKLGRQAYDPTIQAQAGIERRTARAHDLILRFLLQFMCVCVGGSRGAKPPHPSPPTQTRW